MDDYQISKDMTKGQQAKELLENPLLNEALAAIEAAIYDEWKSTKTHQQDLREEAWLALRGLQRFESILHKYLNDGKIALAEREKKAKKLKTT